MQVDNLVKYYSLVNESTNYNYSLCYDVNLHFVINSQIHLVVVVKNQKVLLNFANNVCHFLYLIHPCDLSTHVIPLILSTHMRRLSVFTQFSLQKVKVLLKISTNSM